MFSQRRNYAQDAPQNQVHEISDSITMMKAIQQLTLQFQLKERQLQQENSKLRQRNNSLVCKVNILENKQDELTNEIQDMRQLVKRTYQEGQLEVQDLRQRNAQLITQNQSLSKSLSNLQANVGLFAEWKQGSELLQ